MYTSTSYILVLHTWCMYFFPSHLLSSPFFFSLPLSRNSDPGSYCRFFPPLPTTYGSSLFIARKDSTLSSLVDSRRVAPTHARRSQQLILHYFCKIYSKSHHGGIRTPGPTLEAFESNVIRLSLGRRLVNLLPVA